MGQRRYWEKYVEDTIRSRVKLNVTPLHVDLLVEELKTCAVHSLIPTPGSTSIIVYYDEKLASEAQSRPWCRKSPSRRIHQGHCITAKLDVDGKRCRPGTLWFMPDHGKRLNAKSFKKLFLDRLATNNRKFYTMHYDLQIDEDSLRRRKRCVRNRIVEQTERLFVFTDDLNSIPDRRRKHYGGTNRGRSWGFIALEPQEHTWHLPWEAKQACLGDAIRPVGGPSGGALEEEADGDDEGGEMGNERLVEADTPVPFAWHSFPKLVYDELLHVNNCVGVIDFTPGDGLFAMAVLERERGGQYCGWCHTETHVTHLYARLKELVLQAMQTEGNPLYNLQCAAAMDGKLRDTTLPVKEKTKKEEEGSKKKVKKTEVVLKACWSVWPQEKVEEETLQFEQFEQQFPAAEPNPLICIWTALCNEWLRAMNCLLAMNGSVP